MSLLLNEFIFANFNSSASNQIVELRFEGRTEGQIDGDGDDDDDEQQDEQNVCVRSHLGNISWQKKSNSIR